MNRAIRTLVLAVVTAALVDRPADWQPFELFLLLLQHGLDEALIRQDRQSVPGDLPAIVRKLDPLVLDADGLNAHAGRLDALAQREGPTVLTPHAGELGRLLEVESAAVGERRLHHAREAARRANAIVVLKGDDTLVVSPPSRRLLASETHSNSVPSAVGPRSTCEKLSGETGAVRMRSLNPLLSRFAMSYAMNPSSPQATSSPSSPASTCPAASASESKTWWRSRAAVPRT